MTEGITHTSGVGSGSTILGDLMIIMPPVMQGLSVREVGVRCSFPRIVVPLSDVFTVDAIHVSPLTL